MLDFEGIQGLADFNEILSAADSSSIFSGEASFELHFTFSLFERIKTADKAGDIAEIEKQLKQYILMLPTVTKNLNSVTSVNIFMSRL